MRNDVTEFLFPIENQLQHQRGVFKTTDGGTTWQKTLYLDERTGAIDLVMDPSSPDTLWAATWQRTRLKWNDPRTFPGYGGSW